MRIWAIATVVVGGILAASAAAQNDRLVIAIDTFENPANYGSSTIGNALTDMFITSLSRTGAFTVMDGRGGEPIEADLYLGAKITNFSYHEEAVAASDRSLFSLRGSSSERTFQQTMNVRIDITAVDDSQEILFSEGVEHSETNTSSSARAADYNRLVSSSVSVSEMTGSMMGRATEGAIERAVERLTTYFEILGPIAGPVEGTIVALVDSRTAVINKGSFSGLGTGDELEVLRDDPVTNAAGQVVFSRQTNIGTATVSEVQDEGALIDVAPGVEVQEGDIVMRGATGSSPSEYIRRGAAFFDAGFYWATLREYRRAQDLVPDVEVDDYRLGVAYLKTNDSDAAFENLDRFLDAGGTIEWPAVHRHTFGSCSGTFTLTGSTAGFRSPDENDPDHWFEVPFTGIRQGRHAHRGMMQGTEEIDLPFLEFRAPSAEQLQKNEGDSKNWSFHFDFMDEHDGAADLVMRFILAR